MEEARVPIKFTEHAVHGKLIPARADSDFTCYACKVRGKEGKKIFQCPNASCKKKIHDLCGRMGDTQKADHIQHKHTLHRDSTDPATLNPKPFCIVCRFPIEGLRYWCKKKDCRIIVHPLCSRYMPVDLKDYVPGTAAPKDKQVFHSFHDPTHGPLTRKKASKDFTCGACKVKGNDGEFKFQCAACGFMMHEICATLRLKTVKNTKLHRHDLKQILEMPSKDKSLGICKGCQTSVKGIRYACPEAGCSIVVHPLCIKKGNTTY